jgi:sortase A
MVRLSARDELSARLASRRMHSILVWGSRFFFASGFLALVAFGTVYVQAQLYQRYLQGHFLTDSDCLGTPGGLEPIAVRFFSQNSGAPDGPSVTSAVHPGGATLPVAEPPPHLNMVGKISIPSVGLAAMVLEGDDAYTLRLGVGHIPGTAVPGPSGNVGLAGHRDTFFRPLRKVIVGDAVRFSTTNGTFLYRVASLRVVLPDAIEVLDGTQQPTLTLITCYPFYYVGAAPKRFIVRAEMVTMAPKS